MCTVLEMRDRGEKSQQCGHSSGHSSGHSLVEDTLYYLITVTTVSMGRTGEKIKRDG